MVGLSKDRRCKNCLVHHLVLETFVGPRPKNAEACHFPDSNKRNNRLENLRWGTRSENCKDRLLQGKSRKLTLEAVRRIRERLAKGDSQQAIGDDEGVSQRMISNIKLGIAWKGV